MTNNLPKYENYKASGVEWLGEIPEHWEVKRLKYVITVNNGLDFKHIQTENGYPVIGSGGQFAFASDYLYDGEVILLGRKGTIDKPLYFKGKFWAVDTMFYSISKRGNNTRFLFYVATTIPFKLYSTATALPSMTQNDINNHKIAIPPLPEQTAIASFIDQKTAKLDQAIAQKVKLIALLKERRQILIHHAVTKGLNSENSLNFEENSLNFDENSLNFDLNEDRNTMILNQSQSKNSLNFDLNDDRNTMISKPSQTNQSQSKNHQKSKFRHSGVDWIGEIPEHWEVIKLKRVSTKITDGEHISPTFTLSGMPFLSAKDVREGFIEFPNNKFVSERDGKKFRLRCNPEMGDVLLVSRGATIGRVSKVSTTEDFCLLGSVILIKPNVKIISDYLLLSMENKLLQDNLLNTSYFSAQQAIYLFNVAEVKIAVPIQSEQIEIVKYCKSISTKIATAINLKEKEIEKLKEYKATLINSAVTGKINVSNYA